MSKPIQREPLKVVEIDLELEDEESAHVAAHRRVYAASRDLEVTGESAVLAVQRFPAELLSAPRSSGTLGVGVIILFEKTAFISVSAVTQRTPAV
jgi:hypothetical protein